VSFLYYIGIGFWIWMIVDAIRRKAPFYWFLILVFVPFGSVIYFALVKVRDYDFGKLAGAVPTPELAGELEKLEQAAAESPSVVNKLALADALGSRERYEQAIPIYREVLARNSEDKQALHGIARSLLSSGNPAQATEHYEQLLTLDRSYNDYEAALDYAEALWQAGRPEETIELLSGMASVSRYINHRLALAHYLSAHGDKPRARAVLDEALTEYEQSPEFVKRRDKSWAARARKMLTAVQS
jgi:hypothetical protein